MSDKEQEPSSAAESHSTAEYQLPVRAMCSWCKILPVWNGQGTCILHTKDIKRPLADFKAALEEYRTHKKHDYNGIEFPAWFDGFNNIELEDAQFIACTFLGRISFCNVTFKGPTDFVGTEFEGDVLFSHCEFKAEQAYSWRKVDFGGTSFAGEVQFYQCRFRLRVDFEKAEFQKEARFYGTRFFEEASFEWCRFLAKATWVKSRFYKEGNFRFAYFAMLGEFWRVVFRRAGYFGGTSFGEANFGNTKFLGAVGFGSAQFHGAANFAGTTFCGGLANFRGCVFHKQVFFRGRYDSQSKQLLGKCFARTGEVDFRHVILGVPEALVLQDADLQRCRIDGTNLRKAQFSNVLWPWADGRWQIKDEEDGVGNWGRLERAYSDLKKNYEDRGSYEHAADFHFGEKEMRRRNPETPPGQKMLLRAYYWLSGYGEEIMTPLLWAILLLFVCALGYQYFGLVDRETKAAVQDLFAAVHHSLRVMTLLKPDDLVPVGGSKVLQTAETMLGPFLLALLALAVRQRLKR